MTGARDELLARGRALFDAGRYFDAHDAWEEVWREEAGSDRTALQGLIQVAAGLHKASLGEARGCVRLLEAGLSRLAEPDLDPELQRFARETRATLEEARRWERGEADRPASIPAMGLWTGRFVRRS